VAKLQEAVEEDAVPGALRFGVLRKHVGHVPNAT
jgi:hypothetical protein